VKRKHVTFYSVGAMMSHHGCLQSTGNMQGL